MAGEKTEKATPKKRKESRKEGQVARTAELGGWISLLLVTLVLPPVLGGAAERVTALMSACLRAIEDPSVEVAQALMKEASMSAFLALVILGSVVLVLSTVITLAQGGFYIASKMAKPDLKKLNLIQGVKRMFGAQAWWELAKMLIKSALVTGLVYQGVSALMPMIGGLVPLTTTIEVGSDHAFTLLRNVAIAGVIMGALDYLMARRRTTKQTNMTKQEVKDEHKQAEGDPMLKGAIRSRQLAASRNRMIADVADADVVLVNPTHVAVALRYRPERGRGRGPHPCRRHRGRCPPRPGRPAGALALPLDRGRDGDPDRALRRGRARPRVRDQPPRQGLVRRHPPFPTRRGRAARGAPGRPAPSSYAGSAPGGRRTDRRL